MTARSYALQGQAQVRVAARALDCAMPAIHVSPEFGWSDERLNGLTTTKPGAPPRSTSVSAP